MKTALMVDDELLIAMGAADLFQSAGYETVEAGSADEAFLQLESRSDIAIVFTDIRMPGSDGLELAHNVRDRWPGVKIPVTSGHHTIQPGDLPTVAIHPKAIHEPGGGRGDQRSKDVMLLASADWAYEFGEIIGTKILRSVL